MKQYTINGFADLLVSSTQFKKLKTREKKLLLLDRCNWYISSIIKQNIQEDKPSFGLKRIERNKALFELLKHSVNYTLRAISFLLLSLKDNNSLLILLYKCNTFYFVKRSS